MFLSAEFRKQILKDKIRVGGKKNPSNVLPRSGL